MALSKETKTSLHILVLLAITGPVSMAMIALIAGAYIKVGIHFAFFVIFGVLYWMFGIDYFEVHHWFGLEKSDRNKQENVPKIMLHFVVLLTIIGQLLLGMIMLAVGEYVEMGLLLALFIMFGAIYWFYGVDFFEAHHKFGLEKKNSQV